MSNVSPSIAVRGDTSLLDDSGPSDESPARAFANGIMLALPLWGLIGLAIWSIF